ncbi:pentapeptide repeat-containing protein [Candidatus Synechococcus calcipolaris G9]|uniref:Pentapeptide repeat-containing protein n=1 Tax=Candidatus Synechococcus calcipolaris G9 TaxID=1497997 RepID=A0ABT6F2V6_9SYNE|nr:pentapeptide repeat-containing protein [Candidatus Synechococcus calcipolaris]MDG2992162.1 pentapeptide repeat-containing protein [Candidatus Synechococcus calcipolaris G9]
MPLIRNRWRSLWQSARVGVITIATIALIIAWVIDFDLVGVLAAAVLLSLSLPILWRGMTSWFYGDLSESQRRLIFAIFGVALSLVALVGMSGAMGWLRMRFQGTNWDAVGALAEGFGALGQILVALLAAYVAWQQYVISKELTTQQNRITQQQTIDSYFQGVADLILDDQGLLEDWPQERAIAEGRTAAILGGLDAEGRAKIIRFLSSAKLLAPLKRDRRLGRPIFDGLGGYEEDIEYGVRVINLGSMLVGCDLSGTDLRWTDLSEANLSGAQLTNCNLMRANLCGTILQGADLSESDLSRTRFFHGEIDHATPRDRLNPPNYRTGAQTGVVIEDANLTNVKNLSDEQRYYCCAWGGNKTRETIPGGCEGIPNKLGR